MTELEQLYLENQELKTRLGEQLELVARLVEQLYKEKRISRRALQQLASVKSKRERARTGFQSEIKRLCGSFRHASRARLQIMKVLNTAKIKPSIQMDSDPIISDIKYLIYKLKEESSKSWWKKLFNA
jgi:hypothetical protein